MTSRIVGRISIAELPIVMGVILQTAGGIALEHVSGHESEDKRLLVRAMDLRASQSDQLAGQRFQFVKALGPVLADIAAAVRGGTLMQAAAATRAEIEAARDDLRRVMQIATTFYGATKWTYGPEAFGFRFADWIARKASPESLRLILLMWVQTRRADAAILSPEEIRSLHLNIMFISAQFEKLKLLYENDDRFKDILSPRHLKRVFSGKEPFEDFILKLESECQSAQAGASIHVGVGSG
jgi:hypothetical protein